MKKGILFYVFIIINVNVFAQCLNADSLHTSNITYYNAEANWSSAPSAHHYIIHYREVGTSPWNNLSNIDSTMTSRNIPMLSPQTTYEWQIKTFCDSTNQPNSGWSMSDTFTTAIFVPSAFNPIITPIIGNLMCNENTAFTIRATQSQNEPDIASTVFWSNDGHFEINTLSSGDIVGDANYTSSFLNFTAEMIVDFTLGPNYAKIDIIDSAGSIMGFFLIENLSSGIKVTSIGPNDGNNYTNGYVSDLNFTDLFVNPSSSGPIYFTADIDPEVGNAVTLTDSSIVIICSTPIKEINSIKNPIKIIDLLGRPAVNQKNKILFYLYDDGEVVKKIIL